MSNWFYYNESGEKVGPVTGAAIKALAQYGLITPETKFENEEGRTAIAGKVKGLTFPSVAANNPAPATSPRPQERVAPVAVSSATVVAKSFCCDGCGTPLKIPKNSRGHVQCPSCRNDCVFEGLVRNAEIAAKENINSGIPLTASPAELHRLIVSRLYNSPDIPLDVFEKAEIVQEERYCVPAYCLPAANGGISVWSGHKKFVEAVKGMTVKANQLVDIEELYFPPDVETYEYNVPSLAAFDGSVPASVKLGRIFLGWYRIVFRYDGQEYAVWVSGDGQKSTWEERGRDIPSCPTDPQREKNLVEKQELLSSLNARSVQLRKLPIMESLLHATYDRLVLVVAAVFLLALLSVAFLADEFLGEFLVDEVVLVGRLAAVVLFAAVVTAIIVSIRKENENIKKLNEQIVKIKEDIFEAQMSTVAQRFKEQKKALRGIYASVTGDPEAF